MKVSTQPIVNVGKVLQKERSGKGGSYTWPICMLQLILKQLINGTLPAVISPNIVSQAALDMPRVKVIVKELPSTNFIRSCRTILQIIGETLAAYRIGKVEQRDQLLSDGTDRHHTALQNLVISVIYEECMHPLILSTSIIFKGETSEQQVESVLSTIEGCGKRLQWWEEVSYHSNPSYQNDIPDPISMNIGKLGSGGALTSDTCDGARRTRRLIGEKVHEDAEALCKDDS